MYSKTNSTKYKKKKKQKKNPRKHAISFNFFFLLLNRIEPEILSYGLPQRNRRSHNDAKLKTL